INPPMKYSNTWLLDQIKQGLTPNYIYFWGHRPLPDRIGPSCMSQWFAAGFEHDGKYFHTAEHWMMYHKAMTMQDHASAEAVLANSDPRAVKAIGRKVKNYDDKLWAARKFAVVVEGNVRKFGASRKLKQYLLGTGNAVLVEASPYDAQWGIGMGAEEARRLNDPSQWRGTNLLGWALMEARDRLLVD
ncbi:MAG: NADAR family protein, partial [Bacteroidota bacterium]